MGAQNVTLFRGATIAASEGTAQTFTPDGVSVENGVHLADAAEPSFKLRNQLILKTKNPVLAGGQYTKGKRWLTLIEPIVLTDGTAVQNVVRVEIEIHPDMPAADAAKLVSSAAQLLFDSDLTSFILTGNLS